MSSPQASSRQPIQAHHSYPFPTHMQGSQCALDVRHTQVAVRRDSLRPQHLHQSPPLATITTPNRTRQHHSWRLTRHRRCALNVHRSRSLIHYASTLPIRPYHQTRLSSKSSLTVVAHSQPPQPQQPLKAIPPAQIAVSVLVTTSCLQECFDYYVSSVTCTFSSKACIKQCSTFSLHMCMATWSDKRRLRKRSKRRDGSARRGLGSESSLGRTKKVGKRFA
jgi:hypothetical protein